MKKNQLHTIAQHVMISFRGKIFLFIGTIFFISCRQSTSADVPEGRGYFDLAGLVKKDISYNKTNGCGELKTVLVNGIRETKKMDSINWEKEMQPLLECDINKPAWRGKFQVDTFRTELPDITIQYHSLSDKINVRTITIQERNGEVRRINITKEIRSLIFSSDQLIEYFPGKGFAVRGEQSAIMMKDFALNVDVKYSCK
jgi:hypothetical protein